jgi:hypothetical protein
MLLPPVKFNLSSPMLNKKKLKSSELKFTRTSTIDSLSNMPAQTLSNNILKTPLELELNLRKMLLNGKLPVRTSKTCTPLPGNTKLLKANSPQLPLKDQLLWTSITRKRFPITLELLPKKTKTSVLKSEVTSSTTPNILPQPKKSSPVKLTNNGSHKLKRSTNLTFKSLKKLLTSTKLVTLRKPLDSESTWLPQKLKLTSHNSLTHMLTLWLLKTPP